MQASISVDQTSITNTPIITVIPIGELDTDVVKSGFNSILEALKNLGSELFVADPVSGQQEARESIKKLSKRNPDLILIVPLRGLSAQVIESALLTSHVPCLICPVQGRFALPSSALAVGAIRGVNFPVELLYAPPDHSEFIDRLCYITKTARAFSQIRRSRIGVIGELFPNLVSCRYNPQKIHSKLGITIVPISFDEIRNSIQAMSQRESETEQFRKQIVSTYNINPSDSKVLDAGIQLHLALKQIAKEKKINGFATECWSGFPKELGLNPCMGFIEDTYTLACEGDVMLSISLLMIRYLRGSSAFVGDLYDLDMNGILTLVHCGASASLASSRKEIILAKSQPAMERGFETMTCRPKLENGPVTIFRFYGQECDKLHMASGELLSTEQSPNLTVKLKLSGKRWDFLEQCFGNHYVVVAGDVRNELKLLGKWLNILIFET
jgi:L-fucose isomerase-like protein